MNVALIVEVWGWFGRNEIYAANYAEFGLYDALLWDE